MQEFQSDNLPVDSVSLTLSPNDPFQSFEFSVQIFPLGQTHFSQQNKSRISFLLGKLSANSAFNFITGNHDDGNYTTNLFTLLSRHRNTYTNLSIFLS